MSTTVPCDVTCGACGRAQSVLIADSANVQRWPAWREQVLAATFMRFRCAGCGDTIVVEHDLLYVDLERHLFVGVFPRPRRAAADACARLIEDTFRTTFLEEAPAPVRLGAPVIRRRVVFGYDELRDKVVAFDAGLDDRIVEAVKLTVILDAGWQDTPLHLHAVDDAWLELARITDAGVEPVRIARALYDDLAADAAQLAVLLAPLFGGPYVHVARCLDAREAA
jgi:hypothetical protein